MMNGKGLRLRVLVAAAFLLMLGIPTLVAAQNGSIAGTVVDDDGTPVPGVSVRVVPEASLSSRPRTMKTNEKGDFVVAGLVPGFYTLTYEKEGHESAEQQVRVQIAERNRLGNVLLPRLPDDWVDPSAQEHFDDAIQAARNGRHDVAVESYLLVLEMAPDIPEIHFNLAISYEELGERDKAIEHYERALELKPGYYDPLIPLSDFKTEAKDWAGAAEYLKRATALKPDELAPQYNLGAVSMNAGDMETAEAAFTKVLEIDPTRAMAYYQLGMIAVSQARNDEALANLEKYIELDPQGPMAGPAQGIVDTLKKNQP